MRRKDKAEAIAQAIREMKMGRTAAEMAADLVDNLRKYGLEIVEKPASTAEKRGHQAAEHTLWAEKYEAEATDFEADGNHLAAENMRKLARESRERAAILRGESPKPA